MAAEFAVYGQALEHNGWPPPTFYELTVQTDNLVFKLRDLCAKTLGTREGMVELWKLNSVVPLSDDTGLEVISESHPRPLDIAEPMKLNKPLSMYFPEDPGMCVSFLICPAQGSVKRDRSEDVEEGEAAKRARLFETERLKAIQDAQAAPTPSLAAKHSNLSTEQAEHPMKIGRPFETTGPPISIYHPVFSKFRTRLGDENFRPEPQDVVLASQFMFDAARVYRNEEARLSTMNPILGDFMKKPITRDAAGTGIPDGLVLHQVPSIGNIPLLVVEAKNEVGTGASDPDIQGSFSFRKLWTYEKFTLIRNVCCCPSFILSMAGPQIAIHGGVFTTEFITQPLTEGIKLANFPDLVGRAEYIAKVMVALRESITYLEEFYKNLAPSPKPDPARYSPFFQEYHGFTLTYTSPPLFRQVGRAIFEATVKEQGEEEGSPVIVKFTPRYGEEAHRMLAEKKLAPKLWHFEELENGWKVVVMDRIPGPNLESSKLGIVPERVRQDIREAIGLLHSKDWVHGDIRRPNIMLCDRETVNGETERGAMLIDFDWVGKAGQQRYPPGLNTAAIKWADGVGSYGIMEKKHDEAMLESL